VSRAGGGDGALADHMLGASGAPTVWPAGGPD